MHVNICQHFYLQKSSRPTPLFASFHSCLGILVTGHDPQPSPIQPGLSLFICSVRPCCLGSETAAVSAAFESTLMVSTPWKIANWGSSFLRGVKNKQCSNHQVFAFGGKYQGIARSACRASTLFHFCPRQNFLVLHQCSPTEQFHAIRPPQTFSQCWREALWETMGFSSPLAATEKPTGHHLDTVWALLKIFKDISMFEFVELQCLMLFNVV